MYEVKDWQINQETERRIDELTDGWTDRQTDRQMNRETCGHIYRCEDRKTDKLLGIKSGRHRWMGERDRDRDIIVYSIRVQFHETIMRIAYIHIRTK